MNTKSFEKKLSKKKWVVFISITVAITAIGISCPQKGASDKKTDVELLQEVTKLTRQLEIESLRGTEYFNSKAYDSLVATDSSNADTLKAKRIKAERLKARIKEPNRRYFLTLLALRDISKDSVYAQVDSTLKAGILVEALKHATYFNAWGLPHLFSDSTRSQPKPVEAIIELGQPAVPGLRSLLSEKRSAPRWGSEERFQNKVYKYRVADYAKALIQEINGQ